MNLKDIQRVISDICDIFYDIASFIAPWVLIIFMATVTFVMITEHCRLYG